MQVLYKRQTAGSFATDAPLDQQEKYRTEFFRFCVVVSLIFCGRITGKSRGKIHQNDVNENFKFISYTNERERKKDHDEQWSATNRSLFH